MIEDSCSILDSCLFGPLSHLRLRDRGRFELYLPNLLYPLLYLLGFVHWSLDLVDCSLNFIFLILISEEFGGISHLPSHFEFFLYFL